jgi:hypothetical protein
VPSLQVSAAFDWSGVSPLVHEYPVPVEQPVTVPSGAQLEPFAVDVFWGPAETVAEHPP